jgi:hypothetical protein
LIGTRAFEVKPEHCVACIEELRRAFPLAQFVECGARIQGSNMLQRTPAARAGIGRSDGQTV